MSQRFVESSLFCVLYIFKYICFISGASSTLWTINLAIYSPWSFAFGVCIADASHQIELPASFANAMAKLIRNINKEFDASTVSGRRRAHFDYERIHRTRFVRMFLPAPLNESVRRVVSKITGQPSHIHRAPPSRTREHLCFRPSECLLL